MDCSHLNKAFWRGWEAANGMGKDCIPLVQSGRVRVRGRCIAAPDNLQMMQEIMLLVSFYIHDSVFSQSVDISWKLDACGNIDSTTYPLLSLLNMLDINPYRKADFTPEDMNARKRLLYGKSSDEALRLTIGGVHPRTIRNNDDGTMDIDLIEAAIRDPKGDLVYPTTTHLLG